MYKEYWEESLTSLRGGKLLLVLFNHFPWTPDKLKESAGYMRKWTVYRERWVPTEIRPGVTNNAGPR